MVPEGRCPSRHRHGTCVGAQLACFRWSRRCSGNGRCVSPDARIPKIPAGQDRDPGTVVRPHTPPLRLPTRQPARPRRPLSRQRASKRDGRARCWRTRAARHRTCGYCQSFAPKAATSAPVCKNSVVQTVATPQKCARPDRAGRARGPVATQTGSGSGRSRRRPRPPLAEASSCRASAATERPPDPAAMARKVCPQGNIPPPGTARPNRHRWSGSTS